MLATILRNIIFIIISIALSIVIFNYAEAGTSIEHRVKVYQEDDTVGFIDGEAVEFGQYLNWQAEKYPNLVDYCRSKGLMAIAVFNERLVRTPESMFEEAEGMRKGIGQAKYLEVVRMIRDITRTNKRTGDFVLQYDEEIIETYANSEVTGCILYEF